MYLASPTHSRACCTNVFVTFESQIVEGTGRRLCSRVKCNGTVAAYSKHTMCFECVKASRGGIPCEPGSLCPGECSTAFKNDDTFARAMLKGQRDRKSAKERLARKKQRPSNDMPPPTPPKLGITFVKWCKGFLVSVDVTLAYMPLFRTDLRVDEDIKAQIASLMRKQKERDAERARSSSAESRGSTAGPSGKRASEEFEQNVDKRVSGK